MSLSDGLCCWDSHVGSELVSGGVRDRSTAVPETKPTFIGSIVGPVAADTVRTASDSLLLMLVEVVVFDVGSCEVEDEDEDEDGGQSSLRFDFSSWNCFLVGGAEAEEELDAVIAARRRSREAMWAWRSCSKSRGADKEFLRKSKKGSPQHTGGGGRSGMGLFVSDIAFINE